MKDDLNPFIKRSFVENIFAWIGVIILGLIYSALEAVLFGVIGSALIGFFSWLFGSDSPRDNALIAFQFVGAAVFIISILIKGARVLHSTESNT